MQNIHGKKLQRFPKYFLNECLHASDQNTGGFSAYSGV